MQTIQVAKGQIVLQWKTIARRVGTVVSGLLVIWNLLLIGSILPLLIGSGEQVIALTRLCIVQSLVTTVLFACIGIVCHSGIIEWESNDV